MTIFITRDLSTDSIFLTRLTAAGHRVWGESLLHFTPVDFVAPTSYDWVFGYSSRAVRFFGEGLTRQQLVVPPSVRWAVMGPGTAQALPGVVTPTFVGNGHPATVAAALAPLVDGQRVLFPQARRSRRSVETMLPDTVHTLPLIVYDNRPRTDWVLPAALDVVVFTSPLNVRTFVQKLPPPWSFGIVAIGSVTATALAAAGVTHHRVAPSPDEADLAKATLQVLSR